MSKKAGTIPLTEAHIDWCEEEEYDDNYDDVGMSKRYAEHRAVWAKQHADRLRAHAKRIRRELKEQE